jgi:SAM-dependent methyltransferase
MDLKEIEILGSNIGEHWYYKSKAIAMMHVLDKIDPIKVLDVGAGSGFFSKYLLDNSSVKEAWCVDTSYKKNSQIIEKNKSTYFRRSVEKIDVDLILFMDVLEHVDDDLMLLKEYLKKVNKNTHILITVPAFNFLWSEHDDFLEHKRRYSLNEVEKLLKKSGLKIERGVYFFGLVFPIAAILRILKRFKKENLNPKSQLTKHNFIVHIFLKFLCKIELLIMKYNRFAGLTIFCLAKKP